MHVMVRSRLKPEQVQRNLQLLRAVYDELETARPEGLRYQTFQLDDQVTFVALVQLEDGPGVLQHLEAFQRYRATLEESCDEPPVTTVLREVGSYGFA